MSGERLVTGFHRVGVSWRSMILVLALVAGSSTGWATLVPAAAAVGGWTIECVDCPKYFQTMGNRGLQVDADGHVHIAYGGGDFLYYAWHDGTSWNYETVDESSSDGATYASLALDTAGQPHIAYADGNAHVMYAHKDVAGWQLEAVGEVPESGNYTSLALDAEGKPHMSWFGYAELSLRYAHKDADGWHSETVVGPSDSGRTSSLALDGDGRPHITYDDAGDLLYASWDGSAWQIETVDTLGDAFSCLDLDQDGNPHVSYYDYDGGNVWYAFKEGWEWQMEVVGAGVGSSLALDASGVPQISYTNLETGELLYGYREGTVWQIETVAVYYRDGTALALDAGGVPHIGAISGRQLNYARLDDGETWHVETVDSSAHAGIAPSLAMDGEDYAHMTYNGSLGLQYVYEDAAGWHFETIAWGGESSLSLDEVGDPHVSYAQTRYDPEVGPYWEVLYAYRDGIGWEFEVVANDLATENPHPPSLALDGTGSPHIGFWNQTDGTLKYAYREDGAWQVETADDSGGSEVSLALNGDGSPFLSYVRGGTLFCAYRQVAGWNIETVDSAGGARYSSLALSGEGYPRICYYDSSADDLRYAYRDSGGWHLEIVDDEGDVGQRCSLALDAGGHPHVSYYDRGSFAPFPYEYRQDLKYAHWDGAGWQIETVDSDGDVGDYSSLALDSAGYPHVGYHDTSHRDLKYAYIFSDELQVPVDVKPHSCPNVLNVKVQGSLPVAILGTESLDISQVDPVSVRLEGVAPLTWSVADVATPYVPFVGKEEPTDCTDAGPDGFPDLKLKFAVPELIAALGEVADGDAVVVHLTGALKDEFGGTPIVGEDVVLILKRGKP